MDERLHVTQKYTFDTDLHKHTNKKKYNEFADLNYLIRKSYVDIVGRGETHIHHGET